MKSSRTDSEMTYGGNIPHAVLLDTLIAVAGAWPEGESIAILRAKVLERMHSRIPRPAQVQHERRPADISEPHRP